MLAGRAIIVGMMAFAASVLNRIGDADCMFGTRRIIASIPEIQCR
jgi:hypothetical protein